MIHASLYSIGGILKFRLCVKCRMLVVGHIKRYIGHGHDQHAFQVVNRD
jgi:hypothetical protein